MSYCVFKLHGDFAWPPSVDANRATGKATGAVEIHYEKGRDGKFVAFLRWKPTGIRRDSTPTPSGNVFDLDDASAFFQGKADEEVCIWIDPRNKRNVGERLAFRGAFLFTQAEFAAGEGAASSLLRWPLVPSSSYSRDGRKVFSQLIVGQPGSTPNGDFRFDLHVPTPFDQTAIADKTVAALPFSAIFNPVVGQLSDATSFTTLVGGPVGTETKYASFVFKGETIPSKRLSAFGFAPAVDAISTGNFAQYDTNRHSSFLSKRVEPARFWSALSSGWSEAGCIRMLQQMGLRLRENSSLIVEGTSEGGNAGSLSLTLPRGIDPSQSNEKNAWKLRYRVTLAAKGNSGQAGDIAWRDGRFAFLLEEEIGGYLFTNARTVQVDVEVSWTIPDDELLSPERWSLQARLWVHWREEIPAGGLAAPPVLGVGSAQLPAFRSGLLATAAQSLRESTGSLYQVESGRPESFFPQLELSKKQAVRFALYAPPVKLSQLDGLIEWPEPPTSRTTLLRLSLASTNDLLPAWDGPAPELQLRASLRSFFTGDNQPPIELALRHKPDWAPETWDSAESGDAYFAAFAIEQLKVGIGRGRVSSLEFILNGFERKDGGRLLAGGRGIATHPLPTSIRSADFPFPFATRLELKLNVRRIVALGPDTGRGDDERITPLLIPLHTETLPERDCFNLFITESVAAFADRRLDVLLNEDSEANQVEEIAYAIVSFEPFGLARFAHKPLAALGDAGTGIVATYSSFDRIWRYKATKYYKYSMPPQAIGESMDKPRRLEIHDWLGKPELDDPGDHALHGCFARPYRVRLSGNEGDANRAPVYDGLQRRAVQFRLTPSAEIWIRPSDVKLGYYMPEWQSHQLFRQRGELGLGVSIAAFRAEFLYGLSVGVDVAKERGPARKARLAEIEALTGQFLPSFSGQSEPEQRWNQLRQALLKRPERLEAWAHDPDAVVEFAPAHFSAGVQFALRHTALFRPPVPSLDRPDRLPPVGDDKSPPTLRYHPQGLSGGALWPVESANLFRALSESPQSSGGTLDNVAFSPLGGDATQKAMFLNGKVTIISKTRNGFVESQRVEVIGRVGALWHRAKHVVVYERTVNPSAQFAPELFEDRERTRSRRPILRKVQEYVEILQRERAYPDFSKASARTIGCLERVRFNTVIINVDSAWSRDVEDYGWEIPLWNRAAARRRPQVYPMPDTAFCSHAEGEGETPTVAQECQDCDYLHFFADFRTPTAETDDWPERLSVDYVDLPSASTIARYVDQRSSQDPDDSSGDPKRRRPVSRFLPGMRRFTWRLAPASRKVAINAGRSASPVYVGLESVTFMRAAARPGAEKVFEQSLGPVLEFAARVAGQTRPSTAYWPATLPPINEQGFKADFTRKVADVRNANPADVRDAATKLHDWLAINDAALGQVLENELGQGLADARDKLFAGMAAAPAALKQGRSHCDQMKADALGLIHGKAMLIESLVRDWEAAIDDWHPTDITKKDLIDSLTKLLRDQIRPAFDSAQHDVAHAREDFESAREILAELKFEANGAVEGILSRVDECRRSYDDTKPWSENRWTQFQQSLFALGSSLADDLSARIEEARQRLAMEMGDVSQQVAGAVATALRQVDEKQVVALSAIADFQGTMDALLLTAREKLDPAKFDDVLSELTKARQSLAGNASPGVQELVELIKAAETGTKELRKASVEGGKEVQKAASGLANYEQAAVGIVKGLGAVLNDMLKAVDSRAADLSEAANAASALGVANAETYINLAKGHFLTWSEDVSSAAKQYAAAVGQPVDLAVDHFERFARKTLEDIRKGISDASATLNLVAGEVEQAMKAAEAALGPNALVDTVIGTRVIAPVLEQLLAPVPESIGAEQLAEAKLRLAATSSSVGDAVKKLETGALSAVGNITALCSSVFDAADSAYAYAEQLKASVSGYIQKQINDGKQALGNALKEAADDINRVMAGVAATDQAIRRIQNDLSRSAESARAYGDRVMDAAGKLGSGGLLAAPSNILRLYSAAISAPELAAMKADIYRLRASFDEVSDVIGTTRVTALFNRLGDELKALGLSLPFDGIGDRLIPVDLSSLDVDKVFKNLGGAKLDKLLKGCKIPRGASDAVVITHELNPTQGRAWVQIDIKVPLPGRRSLFSVEVFKADFIDTTLTANVRFEANQDDPNVTQTGFGRVDTIIDLAVAGQSMVRLEKFGLSFTRERGLEVEFDPKAIRINPSLQFVQDFLAMLFPGDVGGMKVLKRDGIPVGLEHQFAIPPVTLNFGTSGISNICISNTFQLTAYPDFVLGDQFWLSRPERPFIFSFFIIGGTGYIRVEADYRPFQSDLVVTVEAGAGGSAALAFSAGVFSGQVFITLSISLSYQKRIGRPGGGLSIGSILVIAGYVDVACVATVGICLMLRMTYRDTGQVDANGSLEVTIRISRFFKLTARANAQYTLRNGQAQVQASASVEVEPEGEIAKKVKRLQQARG